MYLSDSLLEPRKFTLPDGLVVPADGYLLLWADGEPLQGPSHLGFQLSTIGESISLADVDARGNVSIDAVSFGLQVTDMASGSCPDGYAVHELLAASSPGTSNSASAACAGGSSVLFSGVASGGTVSTEVEGVFVEIATSPGDDAEDVAYGLAQAVEADPTLDAWGIGASSLGPRFVTPGNVANTISSDPTIAVPEPAGLRPLCMGGIWLAVLRQRRRARR